MSSLEASSLFSTDGLVAVVTGGGTGIGLMIARALEHNGAKVYILGRREEVLKTAAKQNAVRLIAWSQGSRRMVLTDSDTWEHDTRCRRCD